MSEEPIRSWQPVTVQCPQCGAHPGHPCTETVAGFDGSELEEVAPHPVRIATYLGMDAMEKVSHAFEDMVKLSTTMTTLAMKVTELATKVAELHQRLVASEAVMSELRNDVRWLERKAK